MSSTITMATVHKVNTSEEECIQEEIDNEQLQSQTPMPLAGPSHDKGKQRAEPALDLMRNPNNNDPSSDSPSSEPEKRKNKKHCKKKPKDSDSDDSGDDSGPSSSDDDRAPPLANYPSREATPLYLLYWEEFVYKLKENFGPVDMEEDAEEDLEELKMATNHCVTKYFIAFAKYKARTQFNNRGYYRMVKNALPNHILDDLAKIWPKTKTYELLRQVVLQIDQCYWQTHCEESRHKARQGPMTSCTSTSNNNTNSSNNSGSKSNKSWAPNNSKSKTTTVTVTNTSRKRRIDVGLCIVCGPKGYIAKDCNKARWKNNQASGSSSNNHPVPKARASNTEEKPNTDDKVKAKELSKALSNVHMVSATFKQPLGQSSSTFTLTTPVSADSATPTPEPMASTLSTPLKPSISFVNATTYTQAVKMEGSQCFTINLKDLEL
ncbi:hypothetical protein M422DRAFT_275662 [Sphaerobolus stellatus SS14]|uniref:CCHC-type domain-containing protein n=1 Tax=Sphaerobolus stellatus (strain SS14) TaxID=990650 RepID=A0A0C9T484_SPHS4|nr:hypothetical protein M422DRAFT_275662 [Sphaerobolus stellatus SS14]